MRIVFRPLDVAARSSSDAVYVRPDDMVEIPGDADLWRWDAGLVMSGLYSVEIGDWAVDAPVLVGESGVVDLYLELPAPADVTLRVVSAETGGELDVRGLTWRAVAADDDGRQAASVSIEPTVLGLCRFRCLPGEVEIACGMRGIEIESNRVALVPGENDVTLRATVTCGVLVVVSSRSLGHDGRPSFSMTLSYRRADGSGPVGTAGSEQGLVSLSLPEPGDYEVTIDPIEGYEPVEPFQVTVGIGEWTHHALALQRDGTKDEE